MPSAFLSTKLTVPNPGDNLVARPRLFQKLNQSLAPNKRLTVMAAPAGYGKTALASSWIRQRAEPVPALKVAWVSLDAGDNDLVRFWSYLVSAIQRQETQLGAEALALLASPGGFSQEMFLVTLLNDMARSGGPWVLALDDYHFIEEPSVHRTMACLIDRLPEQCHVLILTRSDPPFPLNLLRGRGQLLEIRQDDLCFQDGEASTLLVDCLDLDLTLQEIQLLNAKTEGWASGLQLAAVSLRGHKDRARFIQSFTGTNRYILDYLVGEVLERQEPEVREFLLQTSILEVLSAPLCAAIVDIPEVQAGSSLAAVRTQALLERLQRSNLFVIPLDDERSSFRYHQLFADLLRKQLTAVRPELVRTLHARASAWLEQHGMVEQAIQHALLAQQYARSLELLDNSADAFWSRGEHASLLRLIRSFPESYRATSHRLLIYEAASCVSSGRLTEAEDCLDRIERQAARLRPEGMEFDEVLGRVAAVRVLIAAYRGDPDGALSYARTAREHLQPGETAWSSRYAVAAGNVLFMAGRFREGQEEMARAMQAGLAADSPFVYLVPATMLSVLAWSQGRGRDAWQIVQEARAYLGSRNLEDRPVSSGIAVAEGILLLEQGLLDEAEALIRRGLQLATSVEDSAMIALAYLGLVMCRLSWRDWRGADEFIDRAEQKLEHQEYPIWTECILAGARSVVMIRERRLEEAERYLQGRKIVPDGQIAYPHQNEYLSLALLLVRQGRLEAAQGVLDRLEHYCEASEMQVWRIAILLLRGHIYLARGQLDEVRDALRSAWALARSSARYQDFQNLDGELLPFFRQVARVDEAPEPVWRLITQAPGAVRAEASIPSMGVVEVGPSKATEPLLEHLTERELEVLRLIAAGLSNREISRRLHVEVQTVKFHAGNIYGKLAVQNRVQAVTRGQELGILSPTGAPQPQ